MNTDGTRRMRLPPLALALARYFGSTVEEMFNAGH